MSGPVVHLQSTYYLPSWQGGDVLLPRCAIGEAGYFAERGVDRLMTAIRDAVTCPSCRGIMTHGVRPNGMVHKAIGVAA